MDRQEMESIRKNNSAIVQDICSKYGLYGNVVYYEPSPIAGSSLNRMYIVAGMDPVFAQDQVPKGLRPDEMIQTIQQNEKLFYPRAWALDLLECKDELTATDRLVAYCHMAEFITKLYGEYGLTPPVALRVSEVHQLMNFRNNMDSPYATPAIRKKYQSDLEWFFKREKSRNKFRKKWLHYFRSEKFPDDKGPIAKLVGYFKRNQCKVSLSQLMESNSDINKLELQEYEYKLFQNIIQERYPYITYSAGDKDIVDHGISKGKKIDDAIFGKLVTAEEYAVIRKDKFAEQGWDCVANLKPAYWEFRNVYYRECDEPIIASVYQQITLPYAKCDSLSELKSRGPMRLKKIPASDFMNFVSLAKALKLRFYIDTNGDFEKPSLDNIHVLYNEHQQQKMDEVVDRMIKDKVDFSHILDTPARPALNSVINKIEQNNRFQPRNMHRGEPPFQK